MQVLKVEVPNVRFEPFTPWGEALGFEFSPDSGPLCQGWVYGEIVSQPLLLSSESFFSHLPYVYLSLSQSLGFLRSSCFICTYRLSVSLGGDEFRIILRCHLAQELEFVLFQATEFVVICFSSNRKLIQETKL